MFCIKNLSKNPKPDKDCVLTINGGSSSIKFGLYEVNSEAGLPRFELPD